MTYVASSGDSGELAAPYELEWPASSPYVVSVGGTTLYLDSIGNRVVPLGIPSSETAWSTSGGGISAVYHPVPSFQTGWQTTGWRTVPDVSYVADPNTGVGVVYGPSLYEVGGTSIGAPQWAALISLVNQSRSSRLAGILTSTPSLEIQPPRTLTRPTSSISLPGATEPIQTTLQPLVMTWSPASDRLWQITWSRHWAAARPFSAHDDHSGAGHRVGANQLHSTVHRDRL